MDAGDLHWERLEAGIYETMFYANGYRYRIVKKQSYYDSTPTWTIWLRWDMWTGDNRKWIELRRRGFSSRHDTLKAAKTECARHNMNPREKYKFIGRVTQEMADKRGMYASKYLGYWLFQMIDKEGRPFKYQTFYMNPSLAGGANPDVKKEIDAAKAIREAGDIL